MHMTREAPLRGDQGPLPANKNREDDAPGACPAASALESLPEQARKAAGMGTLSQGRNGGGGGRDAGRVRVRDLLRRDGLVLDSPNDRMSMEDTLIAGDLLHQELRHGLFLHGGNVIEEHAFTATSSLREGLSCIFFLNGKVDVAIGDRRFEFRGVQGNVQGGTIGAAAVMNTAPERFRRASAGRQHVHHLVISATPEWLNLEGIEAVRDGGLAVRLFKDHLANHRWTPTPHLADLVRGVFAPSTALPGLRNLYLEGRAIEIVAETIGAMTRSDRRTADDGILTRRDRLRLQRAVDLILANTGEALSVDAIAREAGVSSSGLQRLFQLSEGLSVFEYVRRARLDRAFAALKRGEANVQEASAIAGYSTPANFATAFKRRFGQTPSDVLASRLSRKDLT